MGITHAKVSGVANPADPDLVGGADWDDEHVITGPLLVGVGHIKLTEGGSILSQASSGFASTFSKTAAGTFRIDYDPADFGGASPIVIAAMSHPPPASYSLRWTFENDGTDYIQLLTLDDAGDPANYSVGYITVHAAAIL